MVLKSRPTWSVRTTEVPVRFLKDKEGRESHHKREGWFSPWKAAWINLQGNVVYGADSFTLRPRISRRFMLGLLLAVLPARSPAGRSSSAR